MNTQNIIALFCDIDDFCKRFTPPGIANSSPAGSVNGAVQRG